MADVPQSENEKERGVAARLRFAMKKFLIRSKALEEEAKVATEELEELKKAHSMKKVYSNILDIKDE